MPAIEAGVAATVAGLMIDGVFRPFVGVGFTLALSFVGSTVVFFIARNWQHAAFSVGCYCEDASRCHRSALRTLLAEHGARFSDRARSSIKGGEPWAG